MSRFHLHLHFLVYSAFWNLIQRYTTAYKDVFSIHMDSIWKRKKLIL